MGFLKRLFREGSGSASPVGFVAEYPSLEHQRSTDAIAAVLRKLLESGEDGVWATFTASGSGPSAREFVIQACPPADVNTCLEPVDVGAILRDLGMSEFASTVEEPSETIYRVPGALPDQLATLIDAVFRTHYGLSPGYQLHGEVEA